MSWALHGLGQGTRLPGLVDSPCPSGLHTLTPFQVQLLEAGRPPGSGGGPSAWGLLRPGLPWPGSAHRPWRPRPAQGARGWGSETGELRDEEGRLRDRGSCGRCQEGGRVFHSPERLLPPAPAADTQGNWFQMWPGEDRSRAPAEEAGRADNAEFLSPRQGPWTGRGGVQRAGTTQAALVPETPRDHSPSRPPPCWGPGVCEPATPIGDRPSTSPGAAAETPGPGPRRSVSHPRKGRGARRRQTKPYSSRLRPRQDKAPRGCSPDP